MKNKEFTVDFLLNSGAKTSIMSVDDNLILQHVLMDQGEA